MRTNSNALLNLTCLGVIAILFGLSFWATADEVDNTMRTVVLNDNGDKQSIRISFSPDPATDITIYTLEGHQCEAKIELYNSNGKLVKAKTESHQTGVLDLEALPAGAYTVKVTDGESTTTTELIKK